MIAYGCGRFSSATKILAFIKKVLINNPLRTDLPSLILMLVRKENGMKFIIRISVVENFTLKTELPQLGSTVFFCFVIFVFIEGFFSLNIDKSVW